MIRKYFPPVVCGFLILAFLFFFCSIWLSSFLVYGWIFLGFAGLKILNRLSDFFPASISFFIHWAHAIVFELFGILLAGLLRPLGYIWKLESRGGDGQPILLIHGYLHDSSAWIYHRWQLRSHGFGPIYMLNLGYPFLSIRDYVKKVEAKVSQIKKETGRKDLILIGHSMGGIVSALYALRAASPDTVTRVIAIGSPLGGTHLARIALGADGKEMRRNSELLKKLPEEILSHPKIRFYHIATKTDQIVIPYTSELVGAVLDRQYLLNDIGHVSLLYSPRVSKRIINWLAD